MRSYLTLLIAIFLFGSNFQSGMAQSDGKPGSRAMKEYREAELLHQKLELKSAIKILSKITKRNSQFADAWILMGFCFLEMGKEDDAFTAFQKGYDIDPVTNMEVAPQLAKIHYRNGRYNEASKFIDVISDSPIFEKKYDFLTQNIHFAVSEILKYDSSQKVVRIVSDNSLENQYFPAITIDALTLVYTAQAAGDAVASEPGQEDLFIADFDGFTLSGSRPLSEQINTVRNEGTQALRQDGRMIIYTACSYPDSKGGCDLYFSYRSGNSWTRPENAGYPINSRYWESTPCLSPDGRTIYFSSNRPGGMGGMDIWRSDLSEQGTWKDPVNLGSEINSELDEFAPFLHPDGNSFYFSSNGHVGMGGYDLFYSSKSGELFLTPINLGYPINTYRNEFGIAMPGLANYIVFASDRDSLGQMSLYRCLLESNVLPDDVGYITGLIVDSVSNNPLQAQIEVTEFSGQVLQSVNSDLYSGEFLIGLPLNRKYVLAVKKKGYFYSTREFFVSSSDKSGSDGQIIRLRPLVEGEKLLLKNIFFEFDSAVLTEESIGEVNLIAELLLDNPNMQIEVGGHTDSVGSVQYNDKLSYERAFAIKSLLVERYGFINRIRVSGYGSSRPVESNETEAGRAMNRRTEITILK